MAHAQCQLVRLAVWPFALWTIYSWRHFLRRPHIALPLLIVVRGAGCDVACRPAQRTRVPARGPAAGRARGLRCVVAQADGRGCDRLVFPCAVQPGLAHCGSTSARGTPVCRRRWRHRSRASRPGSSLSCILTDRPACHRRHLLWIVIVAWRVRVRPPMVWTGPVHCRFRPVVAWLAAVALFAPASITPAPMPRSQRCWRSRSNASAAILRADGRSAGRHARDAGVSRRHPLRTARPTPDLVPRRAATGQPTNSFDDAPPVGRWKLAYEVTRRARFDEAFRIWVRAD